MASIKARSSVSSANHSKTSNCEARSLMPYVATRSSSHCREIVNGQARDCAQAALRELRGLLTANRALANPPQGTLTTVADLVTKAADRYGARLKGEIGTFEAMIAPASMMHAFAVLLDLIAGPV